MSPSIQSASQRIQFAYSALAAACAVLSGLSGLLVLPWLPALTLAGLALGLILVAKRGLRGWSRLAVFAAVGLGLAAGGTGLVANAVGLPTDGVVSAGGPLSVGLGLAPYTSGFLCFASVGLAARLVPVISGTFGRMLGYQGAWCCLYFGLTGVLAAVAAASEVGGGVTSLFPPAMVSICFALYGVGLLAAGRFDRCIRRMFCAGRVAFATGSGALRFGLILGMVGLFALGCVAASGVLYGRARAAAVQARAAEELQIVAASKVAQVEGWRAERLLDARVLARTPFLARAVAALARNPNDAPTRAELSGWMHEYLTAYAFSEIAILDIALRPLGSRGDAHPELSPAVRGKLAAALAERRVLALDYEPGEGALWHLDVIVPLLGPDGSAPVGLILMTIDPARELFPVVKSPAGLRHAIEAELLVGGDFVRGNTAGRAGATSAASFEARAARSEQGSIEARDARGVAVLGFARAVPASAWVMAVKVDRQTLLAPVAGEVAGLVGGLVAAAGVLGLMLGGLRRRSVYQRLRRESQHTRQLRDLRARLAVFLSQANDAIILVDEALRIVEVNDRATVLYGYAKSRLLDLSLPELMPAGTSPADASALLLGVGSAGLLIETLHRHADGANLVVELSIRRIELDGFPHFLVLIRDLSERKRIEGQLLEARAEAERRALELAAIMRAVPAAVFVTQDPDCREISGNRVGLELLGLPVSVPFAPSGIVGIRPSAFRVSKDGREVGFEDFPLRVAALGKYVLECECDMIQPDGSIRTLLGNAKPLLDAAGQARGAIGAFVDVTDWRKARDRQQVLFEHSPTALWEEDFSAVQDYFVDLRRAGSTDFRRHLDANPAAVSRLAGLVKFIRSNRAGLDIVGAEDERVLAAGLPRFFNADSLAAFKEELIALEAGARSFDCELPVVDLQGRVRLIQLRLGVPEAFHRTLGCVLVSFSDLTDQRKAEALLHERERIFFSIVDQAAEGIAIVESASGRIVEFNEAAHRKLGYSRGEFATLRASDLFEARSVELFDRKAAEVLQAGAIAVDGMLRKRSGELMDAHISARHLVLHGTDFIAAIWSDISVSKQTERELKAAQRDAERYAGNLEAMMDTVPAAIFIAHDPECRHITGNRVTRSMLGLTPEANISKSSRLGDAPVNFRTFKNGREVPPDDLPVQRAARGVVVTADELDLLFADGTVRTTLGEARPLLDAEGRPRGAVGVFFDITERKRMEQSVRDGRDLLAETQRIAHVGSWELDHTLDRLSLSDEIYNLFELTPTTGDADQLLRPLDADQRDRFRSLIHPEDRARVDLCFDESVRMRTDFAIIHRVLLPDGRVKCVSQSARTYFDADGAARRSLGTVIDLTAQYQAEEALRRNERLLSSIFEGASIGICYADAELGIQKVNARLGVLLGYSVEELQALDHRVYTLPEDAVVEDELVRAIREGRSDGFGREKRFIRKDGTSFWGNLSLSASRDGAGRLAGFVVMIEDVSERRQARETLRQFNVELEERVAARSSEIQGLLDSIPDTVLICGADGAILSCHLPRSASEHAMPTNYPAGSGPGYASLMVNGVAADVCARVRVARSVVVHEYDREFDGVIASLEARAAPVGMDRILILVRDISERKRVEREVIANLERERQLSEMKSQFISVASHEFRTPLAAAVITAQLLERYGDRVMPEKRVALLARLDRSLQRLTEIINDVLIVSRADANRVTVQLVATDLAKFVREVVNEIAEADRQGHEFSFQYTGPIASVQADVKLLHHILSNIIGNAVKYSPEGTTVRVALEVGERDFTVTVADQGIGVPAGEEERIFEAFGRGSNVGEIGGTGLGLDIVRRFTELMGGRITLVPSARGATFRIMVPLIAGDSSHVAA